MPIIIQLTSIFNEKPTFFNAANIQCFTQEKTDNKPPYTVIFYGENECACVTETPEEIKKSINEKKAELMEAFANALLSFAEGRKS